MTRICRLFVAFLSVVVVVTQASAQDEGSRPEHIGGLAFLDEVEVTIASIVVLVTDDDGNRVTDLEIGDFRVLQDGVERPLSNFHLFTEAIYRPQEVPEAVLIPEPSPTPTADEPEIAPWSVVFYVDHENLYPFDRNQMLSQLRPFVNDISSPHVKMMVIASTPGSFSVIQDFTSEPEAVLRAFRSQRTAVGGRLSVESSERDILELMQRDLQDDTTPPAQGLQRAWSLITDFTKEQSNALSFSLASLRNAINTLAGLPGRKALIYISNGMPLIPGLGLQYALASAYNQTAAVTAATEHNRIRDFEALVSLANAQGVTVYTIDASGVPPPPSSSAELLRPADILSASYSRDNYLDTLRMMADGTGGTAIFNANDIRGPMERVRQDFFTYYSLGYPITATGGDAVHRVKVELPEHPQYELRYRKRLVEKSLETRISDRVMSGLVFPVDENPMEIDATPGAPEPAAEKRWILPVDISFPLPSVALLPDGEDYVGRVTVFVAARDNQGKQSDLIRQSHEVRVPAATYQEAESRRYVLPTRMLMEEGRYLIVIGLLDQVTRQVSYQTVTTVIRP